MGVALNHFLPDGIRWRFLRPTLSSANSGVTLIDAAEAFAMHMEKETDVIDVRDADAFRLDHIADAVSLPWESFLRNPDRLDEFDPTRRYLIYCFEMDCYEAKAFAQEMARSNFENVYILVGGFSEWLEMGFPVDKTDISP